MDVDAVALHLEQIAKPGDEAVGVWRSGIENFELDGLVELRSWLVYYY